MREERGTDHSVTPAGGGSLIRRRRPGSEGLSVTEEAALLRIVASRCSLPVPRVLRLWPDENAMEMERMAGQSLLEFLDSVPLLRGGAAAARWAAQLGRFQRELAELPAELLEGVVEVDATPPAEYLAEAVAVAEVVDHELPATTRQAVLRFLRTKPPAPAAQLVLCHADMGIEHVFVDPESTEISGIIDWSDAAVTDPAIDLGLLLRDLGRDPFLRALASRGRDDDGLAGRAEFYARVRALEDLAFGLEEGMDLYTRNARRALESLFEHDGGA